MADEEDKLILESEEDLESAPETLDDSIFMGQMDLMKEVEEVDDSLFPDDLLKELTDEESYSSDHKESLYGLVRHMNVAQKVKLGLVGNKEARELLLREQNKLIIRAVMKNPRMNVNEVSKLAASRSVPDEALRMITQNREWMRVYGIKKDLVFNPRTPLPLGIRLFRVLREVDIKGLARNKDVHSTLSKMAKKLIQEMEQRKQKKGGGH